MVMGTFDATTFTEFVTYCAAGSLAGVAAAVAIRVALAAPVVAGKTVAAGKRGAGL